MVYKICFVSTHGTGKTALAALTEGELKRRGIEAKYISEMATLAKERGLPINEETTRQAQLWILHRQFAEELVYTQRTSPPNYRAIICDRGPDNYCYLQRRFGVDEFALQMTLGHIREFPYSRMYLLPIVSDLVSGEGVRSTQVDFQQEMDLEIRTFLNQHDLAFTELPKPREDDSFRNEWVKIIVNQTLQDLDHPERFHI